MLRQSHKRASDGDLHDTTRQGKRQRRVSCEYKNDIVGELDGFKELAALRYDEIRTPEIKPVSMCNGHSARRQRISRHAHQVVLRRLRTLSFPTAGRSLAL